jgi:hypothetical protein
MYLLNLSLAKRLKAKRTPRSMLPELMVPQVRGCSVDANLAGPRAKST